MDKWKMANGSTILFKKSNSDQEPVKGNFKSVYQLNQSTRYDLYLDGTINEDDESIHNHLDVFRSATPSDVIYLWINSYGGSVDVANKYVQHMRRCQAPIVGVIGFNCASAATYIALNCSEWEIDSFSTFLVHSFSYGNYGHAASVYDSTVFNTKLNEKYIREIYTGFLTEEEIVDALRGRDILLDSDDLLQRFTNYLEYLQSLEEEIDDECTDSFLESCDDIVEEKPTRRQRKNAKQDKGTATSD